MSDLAAEAVLIAGGGRAILLQLADPAIGHAVARHSDFVAHPLRRLENTLTFVYGLVFGTPQQVDAVTRMVNRAHGPVRSAPGEEPAYRATDAGLQLWVAATLYDSAMAVQRRMLPPIAASDTDRVYRDYAVLGTALQLPEDAWPADRRAFGEYWASRSTELAVDDTVREVAHELLHPRSAPLWLRAGMPLARLVTTGLLPPELRDAYRLPWSRRRARRFEVAVAVIGIVNRMLPRAIRHWPKNHLLARIDVSDSGPSGRVNS